MSVISDDDRDFFEDNPDREFRIRKPVSEEIIANENSNPCNLTLVIKISPHLRLRIGIATIKHIDAEELTRINNDTYARKAIRFYRKKPEFSILNSVENLKKNAHKITGTEK